MKGTPTFSFRNNLLWKRQRWIGGSWIRGSWKEWGWMQFILMALTILFTVNEIVSRHNQRVAPLAQESIAIIEENIQEYNTMAEQLGQREVLPPVGDQWAYAKAVAAHYLVELRPTKTGKGTYRGPISAWSGIVVGPTGQVLAAAKKIQETVPAYIYGFQISGNQSQLTLSVLGSE
ncbi:MAG: hypothetical protein JKY67_22925 [Pseudomonadales bacterium]|nr:hypothetical protein [Pseudomonadales bacterium]